ncbi:MAG: hypothetical protein KGO94_07135 [Alphaproteobacteria bacterium]|nr:hypothetical protein [Alphaproteobacteria bacterium]
MKKWIVLGLAGLSSLLVTTTAGEANGRYCLHYPGQRHCEAVFYDQGYMIAPPPVIYYVPQPVMRYVPVQRYYVRPSYSYSGERGSFTFSDQGQNRSYWGGGGSHRNAAGGRRHGGGGKNGGGGGGKNGG